MKERSKSVADDRMVEREFYYFYIDLCLVSYLERRRANEVLILPSTLLVLPWSSSIGWPLRALSP